MSRLNALLLDPSLFTSPYDGALSEGLLKAGVQPSWVVRPLRDGEFPYLDPTLVQLRFYRRSDGWTWMPRFARKAMKGLAHAKGMIQVLALTVRLRPHVIHFQWLVLPLIDLAVMFLLKRRFPVIVTCHDALPFNGDRINFLQTFCFDAPLRLADRVIVHTEEARLRLVKRGCENKKVVVIPHGPIRLPVSRPHTTQVCLVHKRWVVVLFGEIKPYKGVDILIEAMGRLPTDVRIQLEVIVAGRPRMDLKPIHQRIRELDLEDCVELRGEHLSEEDMAVLFSRADTFVFPYRQVDASGVFFLVAAYRKWIIATRVGVFREHIKDGVTGTLVDAGETSSLSDALAFAALRRPQVSEAISPVTWNEIGEITRNTYAETVTRRQCELNYR